MVMADYDIGKLVTDFIYSIVGIVIIFGLGLAVYFTYWHFMCRGKKPIRFEDSQDE